MIKTAKAREGRLLHGKSNLLNDFTHRLAPENPEKTVIYACIVYMYIYVCIDFDRLQKSDFRLLHIKYIYLIVNIFLITVNIPKLGGGGEVLPVE